MKKSQDRWGDAHVRLKELFDQRAGMSQQDFAERYGLGTQGMVWQYLSGYRPLNFEAAAKFAKGLSCTIADISPEMAAALRRDILPVLGKAVRLVAKTAMILVVAVAPLLVATQAVDAPPQIACVLCKIWRRACAALAALLRSVRPRTAQFS